MINKQRNPIIFRFSTYTGDLIYTLASIKATCEKYDTKAIIYLWERPWPAPYEGAKHPYETPMNDYVIGMLKPLLEIQDYIERIEKWTGQEYTIDLDEMRTNRITTMPYGSITRWPGLVWPDMQCEDHEPWIDTPSRVYDKRVKGKILINRTSRYRNPAISYYFLKDYTKELIFAGLPEEYEAFCKDWNIDIPYLEVSDFRELAQAIWSSCFFIGNQSLCFAIAEAMKQPRLLEVCPFAPNVIPSGECGYDFMHQFAFEYLFKELRT